MSGYKSGMKGADVLALLKNGLPIVDDVSKLDPNAELGSMASVVTAGSIQETSFRDLYQADASMLDQATGTLTQPELLSSVSSVKVFAPADINNVGFTPVQSMIYLVTRDFSMSVQNMVMVQIEPSVGVMAMTITGGYDTMQQFMLVEFSQDTMGYTVHNDQVEAFNAVLANGMDWCYFGNSETSVITEEQFNTLDLFVNAVAGVPSITDIYVKGDKWGQLYKNDLAKLATNIDTVSKSIDAKADPTMVKSLPYNKRLTPNTYYTATNSSTGTLTYVLIAPTDTTKYSEYILELKCTSTPSSVSFTNESGTTLTIKWVNDMPPTFEAGFTYLISIANNFGVFAQYVNS